MTTWFQATLNGKGDVNNLERNPHWIGISTLYLKFLLYERSQVNSTYDFNQGETKKSSVTGKSNVPELSISMCLFSQLPWVFCYTAALSSSCSCSASLCAARQSGNLVKRNLKDRVRLQRHPHWPRETAPCPALESWPLKMVTAASGRRLVRAWWA